MNKHLLIFGIAVLLGCVGLSGCNDNQGGGDNRFVGAWKADEYGITITMFSDGTCSYGFNRGVWKLKDGKLVLEL